MSDDIRPRVDHKGVPWCDEDGCPSYDGKRCRAIGFTPSTICEPAVIDLAAEVKRLRKAVGS